MSDNIPPVDYPNEIADPEHSDADLGIGDLNAEGNAELQVEETLTDSDDLDYPELQKFCLKVSKLLQVAGPPKQNRKQIEKFLTFPELADDNVPCSSANANRGALPGVSYEERIEYEKIFLAQMEMEQEQLYELVDERTEESTVTTESTSGKYDETSYPGDCSLDISDVPYSLTMIAGPTVSTKATSCEPDESWAPSAPSLDMSEESHGLSTKIEDNDNDGKKSEQPTPGGDNTGEQADGSDSETDMEETS